MGIRDIGWSNRTIDLNLGTLEKWLNKYSQFHKISSGIL